MSTKKITTVGMLCAMAMIVNVFISFPIVPAVSFLRYDPKDILIVIGGFIYGPMTSLLMSFICSIFEIMLKGGNILDVLMNMVSTCSFACMAAFVYKKVCCPPRPAWAAEPECSAPCRWPSRWAALRAVPVHARGWP